MKSIFLFVALCLGAAGWAECQSSDTITGKVIRIEKKKEVYIIKIRDNVSRNKILIAAVQQDTLVNKKDSVVVGKSYRWVLQEPYIFTQGFKRTWVTYGGVQVWSSKQPLKEQPRLCLNCDGRNIITDWKNHN